MNSRMIFKYRLATRNCLPPDVMFNKDQTQAIKDWLNRKDKTKAPKTEKKKIERMLDRARIHGFEPDGLNHLGQIHWLGVAEGIEGFYRKTDYDPRGIGMVASVVVCSKCGLEFRSEHYEADKVPEYCWKCAIKIETKGLEHVVKIKTVPNNIPKKIFDEKRIADLRKQAEEIQDEIPF